MSVLKDGFELSTMRRTLPIALLRAREILMERFRPILLAHGLSEQQWRVMRVLHEADEMDATDLARAAFILAPSLSRILKTLESRGIVEVRKSAQDGRRTMTRLTAQGAALILEISPESAAVYAEIQEKFGPERISSLLDELDALVAALEDRS